MLKWPPHSCGLYLSHNQHKDCYKTVQEAIDAGDHGYKPECWVSADQMAQAVAANECWTLQWYPKSPVGFRLLSAMDLDVLLEAAQAE